MIYSKYIISAVKLFFCSLRVMHSKRKMLKKLRKNPKSVPTLDKAYNKFLNSLREKEQRTVEMKSVKVQFTRCPILSEKRSIGKYTVSRRAKEVLSETDVIKAIEHHKRGDWGLIDPEDWSKCNVCFKCGHGYSFSRYKASDGHIFCVVTDYDKPKTKIVMEEELYELQSGHETSRKETLAGTQQEVA